MKSVILILSMFPIILLGKNKELPSYLVDKNPALESLASPGCECSEEDIENTDLDTLLVQLFFEQEYIENQKIDTTTIKKLVIENGEILNFQLKDNYPNLSGELVYKPEIVVLKSGFFPDSLRTSSQHLFHFNTELLYKYYPKTYSFKLLFLTKVSQELTI